MSLSISKIDFFYFKMDFLENQLKLMRNELNKKSKCEFKKIPGRFRWVAEEPCEWNIVRFEPDNYDLWDSWMDDEEFMTTGNGKVLLQTKRCIFYFKGKWTDDRDLFTCPQDDYQFARFKQCVEDLRNPKNWTWAVSKLFLKGVQGSSTMIDNNKCIPDFKVGSINVIVGTPGAGKSTFCAEFVKKKSIKYKMLYVGPAHTNVNGFVRKIADLGVESFAVLSDEAKLESDLRKYHNSNMKNFNPKKKNLILADKQVTISTINKPIKSPKDSGIQIIIVDEATRVSLLEVLTFIYRFSDLLCVILAGDPKQLGARIGQNDVTDAMRFTLNHGEAKIWNLFKQYRFGKTVNDVLSPLFYGNRMVAISQRRSTLNWIVLKSCKCDSSEKIGCDREVSIALAIYKLLGPNSRMILTPYKGQIEKVLSKDPSVNIKTVDTAQGDEYDQVVFSFGRHSGRGFISDQRINVGLSRARQSVHVIINEKILKSFPKLNQIIKTVEKKGYVNYIP